MPGGSKKGGGLKVKPEYKSPVGYTPFKMKGHTLPGIKQRSPNTAKTFGVDSSESPKKVATSPGKFLGGLFGSPKFRKLIEKVKGARAAKEEQAMAPKGGTMMDQAMEGGGGTMMDQEMAGAEGGGAEGGGAVPQHGPESHTGKRGGLGGFIKGLRANKPKKPGFLSGLFGSGGGGGGFGGGLFSDARLKEKIEKTGVSPSGIPIYEFNYIGSNNRYSGAMAQDLLEINPDAVMMDTSGYYKVNYNNIDVDMHQINN